MPASFYFDWIWDLKPENILVLKQAERPAFKLIDFGSISEIFFITSFDLENPAQVKPWFRPDGPMLEKNPLLFYKVGFFVLLVSNIHLLLRWIFE